MRMESGTEGYSQTGPHQPHDSRHLLHFLGDFWSEAGLGTNSQDPVVKSGPHPSRPDDPGFPPEFSDLQSGRSRQRMAFRESHDKSLGGDDLYLNSGGFGGQPDKTDVEPAGFQRKELLGAAQFPQNQIDQGKLLTIEPQNPGKKSEGRRGNKGHFQLPLQAFKGLASRFHSPIGGLQHASCFLQKDAPRFGETHFSLSPRQQLNSDKVFQLTDLHTQGRLRHVQPIGGPPKMQCFGNRDKVTEVSQLQHTILPEYQFQTNNILDISVEIPYAVETMNLLHRGAYLKSPAIAVGAAGFAAFVNFYALQTLLPTLSEVFQASHQATSLTVSAITLSVALTSPFAGRLAAAVPRRRLVGTCMLGLVVTTFLGATSPSLAVLIFWRFVQGLFVPPVVTSIMSFIAEQWSGPALGRAMSNYVTWTVVGGFSGRFAAGWAAAHFGWRHALGVTALLNGVAGLLLMASLPDALPQPSRSRSFFKDLIHYLHQKDYLVAFASGFNVLFSLVAMFTYITYYLAAPPFALGPGPLGSIFCVYLVGVVITPLAGLAMGKIGFRLALMGSALTGVAGALLTLIPYLQIVILGLALSSTAAFVSQAAASGYVSRIGGTQRATVLGLYLSFYYLGGSAGALVPGVLWNMAGWHGCVTLLVLVQCCTALLVRSGFRETP